MTPSEIQEIVANAVGELNANQFGWDFRSKLVSPPVQIRVSTPDNNQEDVWLVLDESPGGGGYRIVFSIEDQEFGLVSSGVLIGLYGDFKETLNAM